MDADRTYAWADLLKAFAHPTRIQILGELRKGTQCVTDMEEILPVTQVNISQHLTVLRNAKLVDFAQDGALRCYYLSRPKLVDGILELLPADEELRSPLLDHDPGEPPVFRPGNLLEAARRRKRFPRMKAPAGCLLDFDGELADHLLATGRAAAEPAWPCFHTRLLRWRANGDEYGMIGGTVGAPFAVLVAEELFALGCEALVSISSAGLIP